MLTILAVAAFSFIAGVVAMLTVIELNHQANCRSIDRAQASASAEFARRDVHCRSWPAPLPSEPDDRHLDIWQW